MCIRDRFYGLSFGVGAVAGLVSDRVSLGFVAATEDQVVKHLDEHLQQIPEQDANCPGRFWNRCAAMSWSTPTARWMLAACVSRHRSSWA